MKIYLFFLLTSLAFATPAIAQVAINTDQSTTDPNAMLDIKSSNQGILIPRMTAAQRNAIPQPISPGLLVYLTDSKSFSFYNGNQWITKGVDHLGNHQAEQTLNMNDNNVTNAGLVNVLDMAIGDDVLVVDSNTDNIGINTPSPQATLHVYETDKPAKIAVENQIGTSTATTLNAEDQLSGIGFVNNDQFIIGPVADATATPTTGLYVQNDGKVGIGGQATELLEVKNGALIINNGAAPAFKIGKSGSIISEVRHENGDLIIDNTSNGGIHFQTDDTTRMEIRGTGNIGIGLSQPLSKMGVNGNIAMQYGNPDEGNEFTSWDTNGNAVWRDPESRVGYSIISAHTTYPNNPNWHTIAGPIDIDVVAGDLLILQGQFTAWHTTAFEAPIEMRVRVQGCPTTTYTEEMESWTILDQEESPHPYLNFITAACTGTLTLTLKAKSRDGHAWESQSGSLIVERF